MTFFSLRHTYQPTVSTLMHACCWKHVCLHPFSKLPMTYTDVGLQKLQLVIQPWPQFDLTFSLKLASRDTRDPWRKKRPPWSLTGNCLAKILQKPSSHITSPKLSWLIFYQSQGPESQRLHTWYMNGHESNSLQAAEVKTHVASCRIYLEVILPVHVQSVAEHVPHN